MKKQLRKGAWMTAIAAIALTQGLVACRSGSRGTAQNTYTGSEEGVDETFGDPRLARELVLEEVRTRRGDDARLHVQFNLRNTKKSNLAVEWSIEWFDGAGFRIDTPRHWTPTILGGKGYETIAQTSPMTQAAGFRLGVRKPNSVR